jgi:hypothetical protein
LLFAAIYLRSQGHDIQIISPTQRHHGLSGTMENGNLVDIQVPDGVDVMVLQRITHGPVADAIPMIRAKGVAVVIDIDDDLDAINPTNPAWAALHPQSDTQHDWATAALACQRATLVTVSTPALLRRYAAHGRGVVLPNCVPELFLQVARQDSPVIGWGGSIHSHPDDLQVTGTAVQRLMAEGHMFQVVGPGAGVKDALRLPREPLATGNIEIGDWAVNVARLGIGIAPLATTRFNKSKSWLKPLEYAATGVPPVMSPLPEYERLHREHGVGVLAAKPSQWLRELRRLATDDTWRAEVSERSRAGAAQWTVEAHAWRWAEAWAEALKLQRAGASAFSRGAR